MPSLEINPRYRDFLQRHRLLTAEDFLALPGAIISGHPDRHVAKVALGSGPDAIAGFLKREHHVRWWERWGNAFAGFGFVSHSRREAQLLQQLHRAGVGCPDWIAAGEDDKGRAFLLVRELAGATELRQWLRSLRTTLSERRRLTGCLAEAIAHMHDAGFDQPNLYSKHVLLGPDHSSIYFLDWQRSRRRVFLSWPRRWRNLAALHATLADGLVYPRERLAFLLAYLRVAVSEKIPRFFRAEAIRCIAHHTARLQRHRHIRELCRRPNSSTQQLIWLDGEALCVTPELCEIFAERRPSWLATPVRGVQWKTVAVPGSPRAMLVQRQRRTLANLWGWLRGLPPQSPEVRQASLLFRLQRYGVPAPRLLAFGQRRISPAGLESFLLAAKPGRTMDLADWLAQPSPLSERRRLIRQAATVLRNLHEANCYFRGRQMMPLKVHAPANRIAEIVLDNVANICTRRRSGTPGRLADLHYLERLLPGCSATDRLRFLTAYLGHKVGERAATVRERENQSLTLAALRRGSAA